MALSKAEYLERYLSDNKKPKKRKKPVAKAVRSTAGFKIVDDDADIVVQDEAEKIEQPDSEEDLKPVVAIVDNRADELMLIGKFKNDSWKSLETRNDEPSTSGANRRRRHDSDNDDTNGSVKQRHDSDIDLSPPRIRKRSPSPSSDLEPQRNRRRVSSPETGGDLSPPRRRGRADSDQDLSPKRARPNRPGRNSRSPEVVRKRSPIPKSTDDERTLSGYRAGLRKASELRDEIKEMRNKNEDVLKSLGDDFSGRNAATVTRTKVAISKRKKKEPTEEQKQRREEMEKKYAVWNKGEKQVNERREMLEELAKEAAKPLARLKDDEDLDIYYKGIANAEDPMLAYMEKKSVKEAGGSVTKPRYKGAAPPNRFGILPGYRWDGVDRSNGFEAKFMASKNLKQADAEETYKIISGLYE